MSVMLHRAPGMERKAGLRALARLRPRAAEHEVSPTPARADLQLDDRSAAADLAAAKARVDRGGPQRLIGRVERGE